MKELEELIKKWNLRKEEMKNWRHSTPEPRAKDVYGAKEYQLMECIDSLQEVINKLPR